MTKSKIKATITKGYDALTPVCNFNTIAGNEREKRSLDDDSITLQMMLIEEEFQETLDAMSDENLEEVLDGAADLIVVAAGLIHKLGYNPNDIMKIVNESNLSKFCDSEEEADKSVAHYQKSSRYSNVYWEKVGNKYVVFGWLTGANKAKILKSVNYKEADFSHIV